MRYRKLGRSGVRVSELCLGTMTFGDDWGWGAPPEVSRKLFDAFVEAGGTFIDSSNNYTNGSSEKLVGEFVGDDRDYFVIATKYTLRRPGARAEDLNAGGNSRKSMTRSVESSLRRLGTDYIDLLYLHMWDFTTPLDEILRGLDDLVRAGKVLYVGFSDTPAWVVARAHAIAELRGWTAPVAYQAEYSLSERSAERDILPMAGTLDMAVCAFSLLDGGALTGKFNTPEGPEEATRAGRISDRQRSIAAEVIAVAEEIGRTPSQVAINWVRQQHPQVIPIIGARRVAQIEDNLGVLDFALSDEQLTRLSEASPIERGYPHTFWNDFVRRELIFGPTVDQFDFRT